MGSTRSNPLKITKEEMADLLKVMFNGRSE